jgi:ATP-dependent DNA helicase RecG
MLRKELQIFIFNDLLNYFPLRHVDKTKVDKINDLTYTTEYAQVAGKITDMEMMGEKRGRRLVAHLVDDSGGEIELVWFQGIN